MGKRIEHTFDENGIELKWCGRCKQFKPLKEFAKHSGKWDGLQERCTSCRHQQYQEQGKQTREENNRNRDPKVKKAARRKITIKSYGIQPEDFERMLVEQGHKCAICGAAEWGRESPCIDHDHKTGKVRALLCNRCNRTLGFIEDNPDLLLKMRNYLLLHGKEQP